MSCLLVTGSAGEISEDMVVGEIFEVGNSTFYPVLRIMSFRGKAGNFLGVWICPIAMVVAEPAQEYVIALTDEKILIRPTS